MLFLEDLSAIVPMHQGQEVAGRPGNACLRDTVVLGRCFVK